MLLQQVTQKLYKTPNKLFLIDGLGALVSAFSLGIVLVYLEPYIGMPANVLYPLALVACLFAVYSLSCHFKVKENWRPFLKLIAFANLSYCLTTIGLVYYYYAQLTPLGLIYFLVEHLIVFSLIAIEFSVAYQAQN